VIDQKHVAQINVVSVCICKTNPTTVDFMATLDCVNAMADVSDGIFWRLAGDKASRV
jgi:hypothetical protein